MTTNTINYRKYQEDVRHNKEMERLTGEAQAEAQRHNVAYEQETVRSNQAREQLQHEENIITSTHYGKVDFETARHNLQQEYYTMQVPHQLGGDVAQVNKTNAEVGYYTQRGNLYGEQAITEGEMRDPKIANVRADTGLKESQTANNRAALPGVVADSSKKATEAQYAKAQQLVSIAEKAASTLQKFTTGTNQGAQTVQNVLKAVTLIK